MRPVKLTMKAFGSYAEENEVDFSALNGGLYLIVGKTGAGKTTIFDAISYALFGVPSGTERSEAMLHSDFCPLSEDTVVTLDFVHQGRAYRVERSLHFSKTRGTDEYDRKPKKTATLTSRTGEALQGATAVKERCEELLGLNAEQFRRIVMLAQGEFREFLKADSEDKSKILGKLFDSSEYERFQNLLAAAGDTLRKRRAAQEAEVATVMQTLFVLPEGAAAEDYLPGHPQLTAHLAALVAADEAALAALRAQQAARQDEAAQLTRRAGAAETDNALLAELAQKREHLLQLQAQAEGVAAQQAAYRAAERAVHRVRPALDAAERAQAALTQTDNELTAQTALQQRQQAALTAAQDSAAADAPQRAEAERLAAEAGSLARTLPRYQLLAQEERALAAEQQRLTAAEARAETLTAQQRALDETLGALREALSALEGCEADAARLQGERTAARERRDAVTAPKTGVLAQRNAILADAEALRTRSGALVKLTRAAAEAEERHHALYQAFLGGQAGLIAADMERELEETGKTVCPVCNTAFCRDQAHRFAVPKAALPSQEQVDDAAAAAKRAEARRQREQAELTRQESLLDQRRETALRALQALVPDCADWDTLAAPQWLDALAGQLRQALQDIEAALADAEARCRRRQQLSADEAEARRRQEALAAEQTALAAQCRTAELGVHERQSRLEEMRAQLAFADQAAAQAALDALERRRSALSAVFTQHEKALADAKEALDRTEGRLATLRDALPTQQAALAQTREALAQAMAEAGFADLHAVEAAWQPIGTADAERWLTRQKTALDDYARDKENTSARIAALEVQTKGKSPVDLEALNAALAAANARVHEALDAVAARSTALARDAAVLGRVRSAGEALARTEQPYRRIRRLAELAKGANSEGGKLNFSTFVMGAIFREVLEMANRRLDIMTGGRFELIHSVAAQRKNAWAGLEIAVLDVATGKQRPSASISGGEGFMVSLALALGLSDVVQNHAGGQKLDTLFIDEGFGTLDDGKLDNVISVLQQLTEGNRLVGIISHVDKLEESIPQKFRVYTDKHGSTVKPELC